MTTMPVPVDRALPSEPSGSDPRRHDLELSRIESSLRGIRATPDALPAEAARRVIGSGDEEMNEGQGGRR